MVSCEAIRNGNKTYWLENARKNFGVRHIIPDILLSCPLSLSTCGFIFGCAHMYEILTNNLRLTFLKTLENISYSKMQIPQVKTCDVMSLYNRRSTKLKSLTSRIGLLHHVEITRLQCSKRLFLACFKTRVLLKVVKHPQVASKIL